MALLSAISFLRESNLNINSFLEESKQKFEKLKNDPEATEKEILDAKQEITYLESLHENYYIGMNVFRTAKGGRDKIKS